MITIPEWIMFVAWSVGGAIANIIVTKIWGDTQECIRKVAAAMIVGVLCWKMGLPNELTSFGLGYIAIDALEAIAGKFAVKQGLPFTTMSADSALKELESSPMTPEKLERFTERVWDSLTVGGVYGINTVHKDRAGKFDMLFPQIMYFFGFHGSFMLRVEGVNYKSLEIAWRDGKARNLEPSILHNIEELRDFIKWQTSK